MESERQQNDSRADGSRLDGSEPDGHSVKKISRNPCSPVPSALVSTPPVYTSLYTSLYTSVPYLSAAAPVCAAYLPQMSAVRLSAQQQHLFSRSKQSGVQRASDQDREADQPRNQRDGMPVDY